MKQDLIFPRFSKTMPLDIGLIYIIGIGGIGMSAIAEILHNLGYQVTGSDLTDSSNLERLRKLGIKVKVGQVAENITNDIAVVVRSTAVKDDNAEVIEARRREIPVLKRAEMLAEITRFKTTISISGTHGKTTTTAMVGALLETANLNPTVINGGIINAHNTNAILGNGDWLVVEADESDGTFIKLFSSIAVITNIDPEHLDYYGSFDAAREAYRNFIEQLPFYGLAVLCNDHPEVRAIAEKIMDRNVITYGVEHDADVKALNIKQNAEGSIYDVALSKKVGGGIIKNISLPTAGLHNVQNSLSAIAIGIALKLDHGIIAKALKSFGGVKRRFTKTGQVNNITIIDDYGHHPTEIMATLSAARTVLKGSSGRLIAVFQPHRFTRVRDLFNEFCHCFKDADIVIVSDIYTAGEKPIEGIDRNSLIRGISATGHPTVLPLESPEKLAAIIYTYAKPQDYVVCLGAGNVTQWAYALPKELEQLMSLKQYA